MRPVRKYIVVTGGVLSGLGKGIAAEVIKKSAAKNNYLWNSVYKLYYDALHELTESYLRFEKIKIEKKINKEL